MKKLLIMKRVRNYLVIALGALGFTCAINAHAGQIVFALPFGPGLGDLELAQDDVGEFSITKTFESVGYIDLLMIVENDRQTNQVVFFENIFNETGIDWTDYHLELGFALPNFDSDDDDDGIEYDFLTITSELSFLGQENDSFANESSMPEDYPNALWLDDGIVPSGEEFLLGVAFLLPDFNPATMPAGALLPFEPDDDDDDGAYVIALRQVPTIAAVPEPSIIALFAVGLFGLGFARRRMRN